MMRVLHIGKFFPPFAGGIENFMGDLLPALTKSGVSSVAVVHNHNFSIKKTVNETYHDVLIHKVPCHGNFLYAPVSPLFPFVLDKAIRDFKPDIIHAHMPNTSAFWTLLLPRARNIPTILHWHADVTKSQIDTRLQYAYPFYKPFEQAILNKAASVIATSPPYLQTSPTLKDWRHKTVIVPIGISNKKTPSVKEKNLKWAEKMWGDHGARILSIGRLTYYKGHDTLVKAAEHLHEAKIIIAGKGELRKDLEQSISDLCLKNQVFLTGYLEKNLLEALLYTADCLVLPSIERTEAFGVVLLEAMRAGKPAIVCNVNGSGMGWVVEDHFTGLHVPPQNPGLLAKAIKFIARDPQKTETMGRNALDRFNQRFRIDQIATAIAEIYQSVLLS